MAAIKETICSGTFRITPAFFYSRGGRFPEPWPLGRLMSLSCGTRHKTLYANDASLQINAGPF